MGLVERVLGPRVPKEVYEQHRQRYRVPTWCFGGAALLLIVSIFLPYWHLDLAAPQYPEGLEVKAYVNRLEGRQTEERDDLQELTEVNHYVGMRPLADGAKFERTISIAGIVVLAGLMLAGIMMHSRWVLVMTLPALLFPVVFIVDLQWWLWNYGHTLDPSSPFADAVGDFTPRIFGHGVVAQFQTDAYPDAGLILAFIASLLVAVGLWFHRRAYKPLLEQTTTIDDGVAATSVGEPPDVEPTSVTVAEDPRP